jgi:citrate lyase subunit beta / citryl-CoA lyase
VPPRGPHAEATAGVNSAVPAPLRSWLFVPGDSERKQSRALACAADAVILDLEDSVAAAQLPVARQRVAEIVRATPRTSAPQLWVRVNPPAGDLMREDLAAMYAGAAPAGIVLPKISTPEEIVTVTELLTVLERERAAPPARLLVIATETPRGLLSLPAYPEALAGTPAAERLAGITWGMEDLSAALGASGKRDAHGSPTFTFQLARTQCLLVAAALGVQAVDQVFTDFRDAAGLDTEIAAARRDGFSGKLAIHPDQITAINAAFSPSAAEREQARRVVAAFAAAPGAGVATLDGQMIDRPHLLLAQRILAAGLRPGEDS